MQRILLLVVIAVTIGVGAVASAQDTGTPPGGTPDTFLCATPVAEASATPVKTVIATPLADAADPSPDASPIGLYECATPVGGS